jgi:hypothetical protein
MDLSPRILGAGIAKALGERAAAPVLRLGSDSFDRRDLAAVACFNFIAAANLSRALATVRPPVKNTRDVFERVPPSALAVPGVGAIALAVLGAAFEQKHLGGDHPLEAWITTHRAAGPRREFVTFDTLKHRTADREPADRKARRHARRNEAHGLRVARFTKRQKAKTA